METWMEILSAFFIVFGVVFITAIVLVKGYVSTLKELNRSSISIVQTKSEIEKAELRSIYFRREIMFINLRSELISIFIAPITPLQKIDRLTRKILEFKTENLEDEIKGVSMNKKQRRKLKGKNNG